MEDVDYYSYVNVVSEHQHGAREVFKIDPNNGSRNLTLNRPLSLDVFTDEKIELSRKFGQIDYQYSIDRVTGDFALREVAGIASRMGRGQCVRIPAPKI
jgi:hypothetical protein